MTETFTQYYAVDWAAMVTTLASLYLLGEQKKTGFVIGGVANICWIAFNVLVGSIPGVFMNILLIGFNIRGHRKWTQKA